MTECFPLIALFEMIMNISIDNGIIFINKAALSIPNQGCF